ncbi:substrate-binding periplasmic protein [Azospirillum sp. A29]|jgi:octopine/nopaline transport system substrate-binding protein|uniref:substrate-binding periplasmic protein n=1 Tax=Azospirillum sp. A29 TaxID=3160606 RepID=UPI00366EDD50
MAITDSRLAKVDFAGPYATEPTVVAALPLSPLLALHFPVDRVDMDNIGASGAAAITELQHGLAGKTIGVQVSTIQAAFADRHLPDVRIREYGKLDEAALDLAVGRLDALLGSRSAVEALRFRNDPTSLAVVSPNFTRGGLGRGVGIAVRKGDARNRAAFDDAIASAQRDGAVQAMSMRWFGFDVSVSSR